MDKNKIRMYIYSIIYFKSNNICKNLNFRDKI